MRLAPEQLAGLQRRGRRWAVAIAQHLSRAPEADIVIRLEPGVAPPSSRGTTVALGLDALEVPATVQALAHELVHVVGGCSPSRLLDEGLAVHVDDQLRLAGSAWPFYDLSPHRWVEVLRRSSRFVPLADLISGPWPPVSAGPAASFQLAIHYLESASFVRFHMDRFGREQFWDAHRCGKPLPLGWDATCLQREWLSSLGGPRTAQDDRRIRRSLRRFAAMTAAIDDHLGPTRAHGA